MDELVSSAGGSIELTAKAASMGLQLTPALSFHDELLLFFHQLLIGHVQLLFGRNQALFKFGIASPSAG